MYYIYIYIYIYGLPDMLLVTIRAARQSDFTQPVDCRRHNCDHMF